MGSDKARNQSRLLLRLLAWWLVLLALALPVMRDLYGGLLQAGLILAWVLPLVASPDLRGLARGAPRPVVGALLVLFSVWTWTQLAGEEREFYPLVSWGMYGLDRGGSDVSTFVVDMTPCGGTPERIPYERLFRGDNALFAGVDHAAMWALEWAAPEDRPRRLAELDAFLAGMASAQEARNGSTTCRVTLHRHLIPAADVGRRPLPAPLTVRELDLR